MNLKSTFLAAAMLMPLLSFAQIKAPVKVGVRFGVNTSNISETRVVPGYTVSHEPQWKPGFTAGAIIDIPMSHNFYLTPGFYYDYRHDEYTLISTYPKMVDGVTTEVANHTFGSVTTNWFQVPMLVSYRIPVKIVEFQFDFGPYISLGLGGRDNVTTMVYDSTVPPMDPQKIKHNAFGYGDDSRYFNIDWGFDFGFGMLFARHYYVGAHYLIGARNLALNKQEIRKAHSHQWQFSVGYNF
jgi:hypothetical protein